MLVVQFKILFQLNKYYNEWVQMCQGNIIKIICEVCKVVQDVLKEVEVQEFRFISFFNEVNGCFEGLDIVFLNEFEVVLYFN